MTNDVCYRPSRQFTLTGSLVMLVAGGIAAVILGYLYAYLILWNPLIYINILAAVFFGGLLGAAATIGVRFGKVRWPMVAFTNGLIVGVIGLYVSWVVWLHALAGRTGVPGVWPFDPSEIVEYMKQISVTGVWSLRGSTPTGGVLYLVWGIEALIIVLGCALVCAGSAGDPFCEDCETWTEDTNINKVPFGLAENVDQLRTALEAGDVESLTHLPLPSEAGMSQVSLSACAGCRALGFLTVEQVLIKGSGKKAQAKRSKVVEHLILDEEKIERLRKVVVAHAQALTGGEVVAAEAPESDSTDVGSADP